MQKPTIVLVEGEASCRRQAHARLLQQGWKVIALSDTTAVLQTVRTATPDLVIVGSAEQGPWHSLEVAQHLRCWDRTLPVMLLMPHSSEELAIAALRAGVSDYLKWPTSLDALTAGVHRCLTDARTQAPPAPRSTPPTARAKGALMVGESPVLRQIKTYLGKVAGTDSTVLITGETGTGKELAAALIHQHSARQRQPLTCLNCAAIPDGLLESELFGYEPGAFTGAHTRKEGTLQLAQGGTVFFDEIGDMSPYVQAKILRALDSKEVQRLGGKRTIALNIRVIAATNQDLEHLIATGAFRKDLYFRLNVARIHLPPLRERREDIPLLLAHYIAEANRRFGRQVENFTEQALAFLLHYDWPGNVRELKNLVEAAFINMSLRQTTLIDLPKLPHGQNGATTDTLQSDRDRVLSALSATQWNKTKAAQKLHWSRMTLYRKLAKHHITSVNGSRATDDVL
jgi:DNA-binding NtrC family response regulator